MSSTVVATLDLLAQAAVTVKGRLPWSSNATFLVELTATEPGLAPTTGLGVYKPERGERPLWDFPAGLYRREVAAYLLSETLGWGIVPPTIVRKDVPFGEGSVQLFVEADFEQHYFTLREDARHRDILQRICAFDVVANNADRKSGHCLLGPESRIYAIDNGLTFHHDPKLRTVIWDFAGEPLPAPLLGDLRRLVKGRLPHALTGLLERREREALLVRARSLVATGRFPEDRDGRRYPWPLV